jgi:hypothetical protein
MSVFLDFVTSRYGQTEMRRSAFSIPSINVKADIVWSEVKTGRSASSDRIMLHRWLSLESVLIDVSRDGDN